MLTYACTIVRDTHTRPAVCERARRARELTALISKRFKYPCDSLELYVEEVQARGLPLPNANPSSAVSPCELYYFITLHNRASFL